MTAPAGLADPGRLAAIDPDRPVLRDNAFPPAATTPPLTPGRTLVTTTEKPTAPSDIPSFDIDLHTDENLTDPYPIYARLRDAGPVVWLDHYGYYALPRWAEADAALNDWDTFTSDQGVGFNEYFNAIRTTSLMTHGEHHNEIKQVETRPIRPECMKELRPKLREFAQNLATDLRGRGQIDGVADLAMRMPLDVVTELIGLDVDRNQLYTWGVAGFDSVGPLHASRTGPALETMGGYFAYAAENIPSTVRPGGWAEQLFENGRAKGWTEDFCRGVMNDYVYPALDTTINAISLGLLLFARNPEQWDELRAHRDLLNNAAPRSFAWPRRSSTSPGSPPATSGSAGRRSRRTPVS